MRTGFAPSLLPTWSDRLSLWLAQSRASRQSLLVAFNFELEPLDLFDVARAADTFPQVGWLHAATNELTVGFGAADEILAFNASEAWAAPDRCQERLAEVRCATPALSADLRYFGGLAFDPSSPPHPFWPEGLPARFVLPSLTLRQLAPDSPIQAIAIVSISPEDQEETLSRQLESHLAKIRDWQAKAELLPDPIFKASRMDDTGE